MVFKGKIPDESRASFRIAQKYRGPRQSEIMVSCGFSWSTIYRTLKGVKTVQRSRVPDKKKLAGPTRKLSVRQECLLLKAARHFT